MTEVASFQVGSQTYTYPTKLFGQNGVFRYILGESRYLNLWTGYDLGSTDLIAGIVKYSHRLRHEAHPDSYAVNTINTYFP